MSNNPSSRVVARIQPSALIFVVLVLVIGALLLASNNIDPNAGKRAQFTATPVDVFAAIKYVQWKSPDGLIQVEHPETWGPQADAGTTQSYIIASPGSQTVFVRFFAAPTSSLGVQNATATTPPDQLLKLIFADQPKDQAPVTIRPVTLGDLKGAGLHQSLVQADPNSGQQVPLDRELWMLSLDPSHVFVIQAVSETGDWAKMGPIFDHVTSTLKLDPAGLIKAVQPAGAATAAATQAATPVSAATSAATAPATSSAVGTSPATAASSK